MAFQLYVRFLSRCSVAYPDVSLYELAAFIGKCREDNLVVSTATMSRTLRRLGLTRKKLKVIASEMNPQR